MHKNIDKIKKLEGSPKILKNLFSKSELEKFLNLYHDLPTTVHNKKQNVIKKRWLKNYSEELENIFFENIIGAISGLPKVPYTVKNLNPIQGIPYK